MNLVSKYPLSRLVIVFLLSVVLVNPIGDFPINDDYIYAYPVHSLIEKQSFELIGLFSPNIFTQVLWGYLVCLIGGDFSFTLLRCSTLLAAWFGLYFFYKILFHLIFR